MKIERLSLIGLKYFLDAVELGSLSLSAERNHVTRPAISQSLRRLEEWCGFELITHQKRMFLLTKNGNQFYKRARAAFDQMQRKISEESNDQSLRIGISTSVFNFLAPRLKKFFLMPNLLNLRIAPTPELRRLLDSGEIHLAITLDDDAGHSHNRTLVQSGFFELRSGNGSLGDQVIVTEERPETIALAKAITARRKTKPIWLRVNSWSICQKLSEMGLGACLVPDFLPKGRLKTCPYPGDRPDYDLVILSAPEYRLGTIELLMINELSTK